MLQLLPVDVLYHSLSRRLEHNCWLKEIERGTDRQTDNERKTDRQAMRECHDDKKINTLRKYESTHPHLHSSSLQFDKIGIGKSITTKESWEKAYLKDTTEFDKSN